MRKVLLNFAVLSISCFFCLGLSGCAASVAAQTNELITIENSALSMTIKMSPAPYIYKLVHKQSGTLLVSEPANLSLFVIELLKQDGRDYMGSEFAKKTSLNINSTAKGREVVITYSDFPGLDLSATVKGTFSDSDPLTLWTIEVQNNSGKKIEVVNFPEVRAQQTIGNGDDDFVVSPNMEGSIIEKPSISFANDWDGAWLNGPGDLTAQFVAYQDKSAGIYLASQDVAGYVKKLGIRREGQNLCLGHDYYLSADVTSNWKCPYPIAIGVTQGSWQDSADIYKAWSTKQVWCEKALSERGDIPEWWKEGALVFMSSARLYNENGTVSGSNYPKLLEALRYLKKQTNGKIVVILSQWENHHVWTGGDCFPVFDEEGAKKAIPQIEKEGYRPFFYLSGLHYTYGFTGTYPISIPVPDEYLSQFVVDGATGKPRVFSGPMEGIKSSTYQSHAYEWCVGSELVKSFYRHLVDESAKLGVYVLQMDQTNSGAGEPCYSSEHGHVPGIGLYQTEDFHALLKDMRDYGKSKNADFVLTHEDPQELLIPYLDGFHMREYTEQAWPREHQGAVGIPLFSYLYHEYAIGYGGESVWIGPKGWQVPWFTRNAAINLVSGKSPTAAEYFFIEYVFNAEPMCIKMIRNHCQLLASGAYPYLMEGKMLHSFAVEAPKIEYSFMDWPNGVETKHHFTESAILTSSWQAPDGGVGHVFVNASDKKQKLEVSLDTRNAPSWARCDATIYRSEAGSKFKPLWKAVTLPKTYSTTLAPGEVLFIEILKAK